MRLPVESSGVDGRLINGGVIKGSYVYVEHYMFNNSLILLSYLLYTFYYQKTKHVPPYYCADTDTAHSFLGYSLPRRPKWQS